MSSYKERVKNLVKEVESWPKPPTPEVGSTVWVPCSGTQAPSLGYNIPKGHVGEIQIAVRGDENNVVWQRTGNWVDKTTAIEQNRGIIISSSHGHCPTCSKIFRSHTSK